MDLSTYQSYTLVEKRPLYNAAKDEYIHPIDEMTAINSYVQTYEDNSKMRITHRYYFDNKAEIKQMNTFFDTQMGRLSKLWVPTFRNDILMLNDMDDDDVVIDTPDIGYSDWYAAGIQHLFILLNDGTYFAREVVSYTSTTVVIDSAFGIDVDAADVMSISFLLKARLDVDQISWTYITFGYDEPLVSTTLTYKEVD